jgi:hypothetical protein
MRASMTLLALFMFCAPLFAQDVGTMLFQDRRMEDIIGKSLADFTRNVNLVAIKEDSMKRRYLPYNVYGRVVTDQELRIRDMHLVTEMLVCVDRNKKISALISYVVGDGDSIYSAIKGKFGVAEFRSFLNTDEAFGQSWKPVTHLWKIGKIVLDFTLNASLHKHMIVLSSARMEDYIKLYPE